MKIDDALLTRGVPIAYRKPFAIGEQCWTDERPYGQSILEIVNSVPNLPRDFFKRGVVMINGEIVPHQLWQHIRPKPSRPECPVAVTLHYALGNPGGGGGGGGTFKTIAAVVGAIALVILTAGIASGALLPAIGLGGLGATLATPIAFGITGAQLLAGAIGIVGALALSALTAPPTAAPGGGGGVDPTTTETNTDQKEAAGASGNVIDKGGAIPRVVGTRKVFPPLACEPVVELVGEDEIVEALFALNGPHLLEDIRVDGIAVDASDDLEIETAEGWPDDLPLATIVRQGRTLAPQLELSYHKVNSQNQQLLLTPGLPENDLPVWHGVVSRNEPDEIWLHLLLPQGISAGGSANEVGIPFRMRMRLRGDTNWINLPEFHVAAATFQQQRRAVLLKWKNAETLRPVPATNGFYLAFNAVAGQTAALGPITDPWFAHSHFVGSGNFYLYSGVEAATGVQNINMDANTVTFYLNEATFPKGIYEIQIKRGIAYDRASYAPVTQTYGGYALDMFSYQTTIFGAPTIQFSRANLSDRVILTRLISIWNEHPIQTSGFALIAMKARNRNLSNVSTLASGYVRDWDGSGWNTWTTTSNPAPHYVDVLSGAQNIDALPADLRDDDALVDWRTLCEDNGYEVNSIINDTRTQDVLSQIASWGYGRPYQSDVYGIIVDRDRTGDVPVQVFSRRNSANLRMEMAFPRVPAGLIVTYRDDIEDDDQAQLTVYQRDASVADPTLFESVAYEGNTDAEAVRARAQFDIDQATLRNTFYYLDADIESIVCRRGDLVALQHDVLTRRAGDGYIKSIQTGGSPNMITGLTLDSEIDFGSTLDMHAITNMHAIVDMHLVGITTGLVIRHTDGTLSTHQVASVSGNALTFSTPVAIDPTIQSYDDNDHKYGCMVVTGELNSIYRRLLVSQISATKDLKAALVLVDEAPELFGASIAPIEPEPPLPETPEDLTLMDDTTLLKRMDNTTQLTEMS